MAKERKAKRGKGKPSKKFKLFALDKKVQKKFKPMAQCMSCKEKVVIKNPNLRVDKEPRKFAYTGKCGDCAKTNVFVFVGKDKGEEVFAAIKGK